MCSRSMTSAGASEHMTSIASWSPRKSEPLTVSYACECQSSSTLIAALMPPAAATECERTGWTLLMIATLAPFLRGRQRGALAREAGPDDQDVVCWHGSLRSAAEWKGGRCGAGLYNASACRGPSDAQIAGRSA